MNEAAQGSGVDKKQTHSGAAQQRQTETGPVMTRLWTAPVCSKSVPGRQLAEQVARKIDHTNRMDYTNNIMTLWTQIPATCST